MIFQFPTFKLSNKTNFSLPEVIIAAKVISNRYNELSIAAIDKSKNETICNCSNSQYYSQQRINGHYE